MASQTTNICLIFQSALPYFIYFASKVPGPMKRSNAQTCKEIDRSLTQLAGLVYSISYVANRSKKVIQ